MKMNKKERCKQLLRMGLSEDKLSHFGKKILEKAKEEIKEERKRNEK